MENNNTVAFVGSSGDRIKKSLADILQGRRASKEEKENVDNYIQSISKETNVNFYD